jgi:hypothetical protein
MDLNNLPVPHEDGHWINEEISRTVEIIRQKWPNLDVKWIPPENRGPKDAAFAITERLPDGREVVLRHVQTEKEFNRNVLALIELGDTSKHDTLSIIEAQERAYREYEQKLFEEQIAEANDFSAFVIRGGRDKLHTVRHNGRKYG